MSLAFLEPWAPASTLGGQGMQLALFSLEVSDTLLSKYFDQVTIFEGVSLIHVLGSVNKPRPNQSAQKKK